jgi:hypothetical protein
MLALACSSRATVWNTSACAGASRPPPPNPWITRPMINMAMLFANPHMTDARVKVTSEKIK